jgi:phage baseplate assembly protein gpV
MSFDNLNGPLSAMGNYQGKFFIGKVKVANDPEQLDRVKVFVPGLYISADDALLPWAAPIKVSPMGHGTGPEGSFGSFGTPPVDSDVMVILQEGNPHYPMYMSLMKSKNTEFAEGTWGWKDTLGNKFIVGPEGVALSTKCGALFKIDADCKITVTAPGGFEFNGDSVFNGNQTVNGTSDLNGNVNVKGTVTTTGDVVAGGTSLKGHIHAVVSKDFGVTSTAV